ncbi:hypothetical protein PALB_700 [Pseudoalteromonas luteoviolacea B = ATCC 29581]|nr:hypothetical protein PALB_700 [Pseudoalteromonas luteoviolacea B = ATCC 29581]
MTIPALAAEHYSDHDKFCGELSDAHCLANINKALMEAEPLGIEWLKLKSYQLDYFYDKQMFEQLALEIEPLVERKDLPVVFTSQLNFYFAKALNAQGDKQRAMHYANETMQQLEGMYDAFGDPLRVIELANMQYVFGDKKRAYQILLMAENRFGKSKDANFWYELNEQFANVFFAWDNIEKAIHHRTLALPYAREMGTPNKLSIALGNLARTLQLHGEHALARDYYLEAVEYLHSPSDGVILAAYQMRLLQAYFELQQYTQAKELLEQINMEKLSNPRKKELEPILSVLGSQI